MRGRRVNVYVVICDESGERGSGVLGMKPFIAANMSDAVLKYEQSGMDLNDVVAIFVYGKHDLVMDMIKEVTQ